MQEADSTPATGSTSRIAKTITDLDDLLQALAAQLPSSKPWHRNLAAHLKTANRELQILRLTVSLARPAGEFIDAALELNQTCRRADTTTTGSRADITTKSAIRLAMRLSQTLLKEIRSSAHD